MHTRVLSACPLLGGLSSFEVSLIGGFTVCLLAGGVGGGDKAPETSQATVNPQNFIHDISVF